MCVRGEPRPDAVDLRGRAALRKVADEPLDNLPRARVVGAHLPERKARQLEGISFACNQRALSIHEWALYVETVRLLGMIIRMQ